MIISVSGRLRRSRQGILGNNHSEFTTGFSSYHHDRVPGIKDDGLLKFVSRRCFDFSKGLVNG